MLAPQFRQQPHFPWEVRLPLLPAVVSRERRRGEMLGSCSSAGGDEDYPICLAASRTTRASGVMSICPPPTSSRNSLWYP